MFEWGISSGISSPGQEFTVYISRNYHNDWPIFCLIHKYQKPLREAMSFK